MFLAVFSISMINYIFLECSFISSTISIYISHFNRHFLNAASCFWQFQFTFSISTVICIFLNIISYSQQVQFIFSTWIVICIFLKYYFMFSIISIYIPHFNDQVYITWISIYILDNFNFYSLFRWLFVYFLNIISCFR